MTGVKELYVNFLSLCIGLMHTARHVFAARNQRRQDMGIASRSYFTQPDGIVTLSYPFESLPLPDVSRNRLHNEIEDCIVCDKCAKVCPVDCIEIEPVKSTQEIAKASDGSSIRLYAAKFDIDMAKCCYCGLCTTVCPTECLTMTKTFDYSEFDVKNMLYHFSNLSPEEAKAKQELYETEMAAKKQRTATPTEPPTQDLPEPEQKEKPAPPRPFVPKMPVMKPAGDKKENTPGTELPDEQPAKPTVPKIPGRPMIPGKPAIPPKENPAGEENISKKPAAPVMKPSIPKKEKADEETTPELNPSKPVMKKPVIKPAIPPKKTDLPDEQPEKPAPPAQPIMRPKPVIPPKKPDNNDRP